MTQNQKSVALSVFVVLALIVAIVALVSYGSGDQPPQHSAEPVAAAPAPGAPAHKRRVVVDDKQRQRLREAAAARRAAKAAEQAAKPARPAAGLPVARVPVEDSKESRGKFAEELGRRFNARGQRVTVSVLGDEGRTFQLRWPQTRQDRRHMLSLQQAAPFHQELQSRGFKKLVLQAGERIVWEKAF